ncbi:MAG TPA: GNAT family protein [Candidatus Limnocylindrales bacterium]|nr:GNAT family protein [Candidatus Limnocylindrales bacterium]
MSGGASPGGAALGPVVLNGRHIRLEPLRPEHGPRLLAAAAAPEIWTWMPAAPRSEAAMTEWIAAAMAAEREGREYAFAVIGQRDARAIGSTRYLEVEAAHRGVEIGWTWYAVDTWGTVVNPEAKLLLLRHAFETWGAHRVQLKTDRLNARSQAAIRKLGASLEGTLRHHRIRPDGSLRDSMVFSIIAPEWPAVSATLRRRIDAGAQP